MSNVTLKNILLICFFLQHVFASAQQQQRNQATPEAYGAKGDGITDDFKAMKQCFANNKQITLSRVYRISKAIEIRSDQQIYAQNATIKYSGNGVLLNSDNSSNWQISGKLTISGNGMKDEGAIAILIRGGMNIDISGLTVQNFQGSALALQPGKIFQRGNCVRLSNSLVVKCWTGIKIFPGSEYHSVSNVNAIGCQSAVEIRAGNVTWTGGNIVDNKKGLFVGGTYGTNNAHGIFQGVNINHNIEYNLKCDSIELGETFSGCHIYGEKDRSIIINESRAVNFIGGIIDGRVALSGNSENQYHYFNGVQLEPQFNISPVYTKVHFFNCFTRTDGMYKADEAGK